MKIKTSELTGAALDWATAKCEGFPNFEEYGRQTPYSTDWAQGGPIIELAGINVMLRYGSLPPDHVHDTWDAVIKPEFYTSGRPGSGVRKEVIASGPTPLIAAMRCYVASKLGDEAEVPDDLA